MGRFTSPDSLVPDPYNPLDWERYQYARANPVRVNDPSGHMVDDGCKTEGCELSSPEDYAQYSRYTIEARFKSAIHNKGVSQRSRANKFYSLDNPITRATYFTWAANNVANGGPNEKLYLTDLFLIGGSNFSTGFMGLAMGGDLPVGGSLGTAGAYGDLIKVTETGEVAHHMPQAALNFTNRNEGGALIISQAEHFQTRTYGYRGAMTARTEAVLPFRQVLAKDIWDVHNIAGN